MKRRLFLALLPAALAAGCGFQLRRYDGLPFGSLFIDAPGGSAVTQRLRVMLATDKAIRLTDTTVEAEAVLKINTRDVKIGTLTYLLDNLSTTYHRSDDGAVPATANNAAKYVSNALEVGLEAGVPGNNVEHYINPYSGKKSVVNWGSVYTDTTYCPPAVWITDSSTYSYASFPASGSTTTRTWLKGTVVVNFNGTSRNIEIFWVDGKGLKGPTVDYIPMD